VVEHASGLTIDEIRRLRGFTASYLHGGFAAWGGAGLPVGPR
jgi:hypothetical protein